jgi:hypothetical protein
MLDPSCLGRRFGPYTAAVSAEGSGRLAACLGLDTGATPLTLPTCYGLWANPGLLAELGALGAPLPRLLHGEQRYSYHAPLAAGDALSGAPEIVAVEQKRGRNGSFALLTLETRWHNQRGELAVVDTLVVVVRD